MCASFVSRSQNNQKKPQIKFPLYKYGREAHLFLIIFTINYENFCIYTHRFKGFGDTLWLEIFVECIFCIESMINILADKFCRWPRMKPILTENDAK